MKQVLSPLQVITYSLISLTLFFVIIKAASFILIPVAWSAFLAISLNPVCYWLEKTGIPRPVAIVTGIGIATIIAGFVIYIFVNQLIGLLDTTPAIGDKLEEYLTEVQMVIQRSLGNGFFEQNIDWNLSQLLNGRLLSQSLKNLLQSIVMMGVVPVFVFFFIYYQDFFSEFLRRLQESNEKTSNAWMSDATKMIKNYLMGMLLVTLIVSIMAGLVFYFLDVKYFLFFALFVAVFNLIPYVGVILSSLISVIYVMLTSDSIWYPLLTLLLLWLIQLIENNLITPMVVGTKIRLNPLAVLLAIFLGGWVWGISGVVLFIPIMGVLKIVFDSLEPLNAFGYLLGNEIPLLEKKEGGWTNLKKWWKGG